MLQLRVVTYNIRKGTGASGRRPYCVADVGRAVRDQEADLVLLQEVFHASQGENDQSEVLAQALGMTACYRPNKKRSVGHHGNATLSRWPVLHVENFDMTVGRVEKRGALYVRLDVNGIPLHVFNVHLSLRHSHRYEQARRLQRLLRHVVPADEPLLLAGDFNDWQGRLDPIVVEEIGLANGFAEHPIRTWPAGRPIFPLDRVYVRNLEVKRAELLAEGPWRTLSDHLPLQVELAA